MDNDTKKQIWYSHTQMSYAELVTEVSDTYNNMTLNVIGYGNSRVESAMKSNEQRALLLLSKTASGTPVNKKCWYGNSCKLGDKCRYNHGQSLEEKSNIKCRNLKTDKGCQYGDNCRFSHIIRGPSDA